MTSASDYLDFMDRFLRGEAPTESQFLRHFEHQNGMPVDAIPVGSRAPSVTLVDQVGVARTIDELMGPRGLLLAFVRSTYWCPRCQPRPTDGS